ncbi:hypothetical protein [Rickettsia endosymbiont of Polydrusus tereticollis]|uniref:hypothetical protein n=1 Tax=Rickettsia endosymbiont of Polydrusus tereticollis TaxID=3066251 RepID=UPI003132B0C1
MSGISNAKKNLNISSIKEYPKLRDKLARLAYNCLEELQVIRKELTMAYIVSGKVVTEEDDKYEFRNEKEVRIDNKQGQDIDKKQREEEQILKDLKILCSIKNNIADNSARGNQEEKGNIKEKVRNNFLGKILRLLKRVFF